MTPLPAPLGSGEFVAWRLDKTIYASTWDSGEGAFRVGGRWNSRGIRAVYCSLDPATAILELAAHIGFRALDIVPHVLTATTIADLSRVRVVEPGSLPDAAWLSPGIPSAAQQAYGDALLAAHSFVAIPSIVSKHSWNLLFVPAMAAGAYSPRHQEALTIDPRLHTVVS